MAVGGGGGEGENFSQLNLPTTDSQIRMRMVIRGVRINNRALARIKLRL